MRDPWISEDGALRERMSDPAQATAADPGTRLPAYATAFLAHLRLLVGVPFEYLVPDTTNAGTTYGQGDATNERIATTTSRPPAATTNQPQLMLSE